MLRVLVVTNMYPSPANPWEGAFVKTQVASLEALGVGVRVIHIDRYSRGVSAYRAVGSLVREHLASERTDVVHAMYGGVMASEVARAVGGRHPFVLSFCGSDVLGEPGPPFRALPARAGVYASRWAARRADEVIVKSRNLAEVVAPWCRRASTVSVIPNGVDLRLFSPRDRTACRRALGWDESRTHVLFGGRDVPLKRLPLAQEAVLQLGSAREDLELHVPDGVPHDEVPIWLNAADLLLLTSVHEGSPNIVKEALACNTPVVSVAVGDVEERLAGIDGTRVVASHPTALANAMREVLDHGPLQDGHAKIADLAEDRVAQRVLAAYQRAIAGHRSALP